MELTDSSNNTTWAYASMDPFGVGISRIGVPALSSGVATPTVLQTNVNNLHVFSNSANVIAGTSFAAGAGNIEFRPNNYTQANSPAITGASATTYDFGDQVTTPANGYGSFQIHNFNASQTVLAYNNWGSGGGDADLGIGNATTGSNPDWTFLHNAFNDYDIRNLEVMVLPAPEPASAGLFAVAGLGLLTRRRRR